MNIAHLLSGWVETSGDRAALIDNAAGANRIVTFAQLDVAAARIAAQLHDAGLRRGDAVLLIQPVSADLYILFTAILRSGLVAVFIDPSAGLDHIGQCCRVYPPKAFIGCGRAQLLRAVSPALRRIPLKFSTDWPVWGTRRLDPGFALLVRREIEDCSEAWPAIVRFTSGSTGQPKAAMRSHGFLLEQQRVLQRSFGLTAGEVDLVTMPMFVLSNLAAGVTSLIPHASLRVPGAVPPESLWREIERHRPQSFGAAPALLENLADHCVRHGQTLEGLKKIFTGGASVFPRLLDKLHAVAPAAEIIGVYGSTEAEPIALLHERDLSVEDRRRIAGGKGLLAGFPDDAIRVRILREEGGVTGGEVSVADFEVASLPPGEPGQVVVSGPHVQPGYVNDTAGVRETKIRVGDTVWHQTGDAGYLDDCGRLWLLGRSGARIRDGHGTLYPFEVEGVAMEDVRVRRAALLGHKGRRLLAIESDGGLDTGAMTIQLEWAFIDTIRILRRLPVDKRHNSKIDYVALRALLE